MKNTLFVLFISLISISCGQSLTETDINRINGYWEIEKVELPDGDKKEYNVNPTIDFFEVKNNKGFRQKVMPQFDGTYQTNNIKETIVITQENGDYYVNYTTDYGKWKEEILELTDSVFVVKNKENLEYHYKRPIAFSVK